MAKKLWGMAGWSLVVITVAIAGFIADKLSLMAVELFDPPAPVLSQAVLLLVVQLSGLVFGVLRASRLQALGILAFAGTTIGLLWIAVRHLATTVIANRPFDGLLASASAVAWVALNIYGLGLILGWWGGPAAPKKTA